MQISSAIMQNSFCKHNSAKTWPNMPNKVTKPMFSWSENTIKAIKNWLNLRQIARNMQISSAIMQNSVNTWPTLANYMTKPMFSGSRNKTKATRSWHGQQKCPNDMQISSAIMQNSFFKFNLVKTRPNLPNKVTQPMFSWSRDTINAIWNWLGQRLYTQKTANKFRH